MPSASKLFIYYFYMWRKYDVTVTFMILMSCDSVCCMCGEAWRSRWLMTQLTSGQHACMLVFVPMVVNILNIPCDCHFVFSVLDELYVSYGAWCSGCMVLRLHYRSMKCDVSFSQGSLTTLFRWGEHVFHVCVKCSSCLQQCKNIKIKRVFPELWSQMITASFFMKQCTNQMYQMHERYCIAQP